MQKKKSCKSGASSAEMTLIPTHRHHSTTSTAPINEELVRILGFRFAGITTSQALTALNWYHDTRGSVNLNEDMEQRPSFTSKYCV